MGVAGMVLSLLSSAWFPLDLSAHQSALMLAGNLLAGTHLLSHYKADHLNMNITHSLYEFKLLHQSA